MGNNINEVLKEALLESKPSNEEIKKIDSYLKEFLEELKKKINLSRIGADIFIGGSFARRTLIKKENYDVDIFVRFDKRYSKDNISELTSKILGKINVKKRINKIHGSRDYFRIDIEPWLCFEIIPVIKVSRPKEADNITDLSYFHVNYINKRVNNKLLNDIILAKSFCHANKIYGAESHIKGFSGYSLELLIYYYGSFIKFVREIAKLKGNKIIIDIEKNYKNKNQILMDMNSSKLESPIILVDPTYKQRNALATLSKDALNKFQLICKKFLEKPNIKFFRIKKMDFEKMEKSAKKGGYDFILLKVSTNMQEGSIAGSKLLKFYNYLNLQISRFFNIKEKVFNYEDKKDADYFFIVKKKEKELIRGPPKDKEKEVEKFREKHKKVFIKSGRFYSENSINFNLKEFIKDWKIRSKDIIKDMYINEIKILD